MVGLFSQFPGEPEQACGVKLFFGNIQVVPDLCEDAKPVPGAVCDSSYNLDDKGDGCLAV